VITHSFADALLVAIACGVFIPLLVGHLGSRLIPRHKAALTWLLAMVAGLGCTLGFAGTGDNWHWRWIVVNAAVAWTMATVSYFGLWKPCAWVPSENTY
jgi:hypothetical protein